MKTARQSKKGLSAIFATLILIAITVSAGIVIYMFTSGYMSGMMGQASVAQEKVSIVDVRPSNGNFYVTAMSVGGSNVTITTVIIKDGGGNSLATVSIPSVTLSKTGTTTIITVPYAYISGSTYTVTLVSQLGNTFVSSSFN